MEHSYSIEEFLDSLLLASSRREMRKVIERMESSLGFWFEIGPQIRTSTYWKDASKAARYLESFAKLRADELAALKNTGETEFMDPDSPLWEYLLIMGHVVENIGGDLANLVSHIFNLAEADDPTTSVVGKKLLLRAADNLDGFEDRILTLMEQQGAPEIPSILGEVLERRIQLVPGLIDLIEKYFLTRGKSMKVALLSAIGEWDDPPKNFNEIVLKEAMSEVAEVKKLALRAIGNLQGVSDSVDSILMSSLSDLRWFIRSAAARASGRLRCKPDLIVPELISLLDDFEGTDRLVSENAIEALGLYGADARTAIPKMEAMKRSSQVQQYHLSEDLDEAIQLIRKALSSSQ